MTTMQSPGERSLIRPAPSSLLQAVVEASRDAILVVSANDVIVFVNPRSTEVLGYTEEELLGSLLEMIVPAPRRISYRRNLELLTEGKQPLWGQQLLAVRKDGVEIVAEVSVSRVFLDGEVFVVFVIRDTSELRAAEDALRRSEARFRAIYARAADAFIIFDADLKLVAYSSGSDPNSVQVTDANLGQHAAWFVHPDDGEAVARTFEQVLANPGANFRVELRVKTEPGPWHFIEAIITNLLDDPAVQGIVSCYRDITERKRENETRERLMAMLEATSDIISTSDGEGRIIYANQATRRFLGLRPDQDLKGITVRNFSPPETERRRLLRNTWDTVAKTGQWSGTASFLDAQGNSVLVSMLAFSHKSSVDNNQLVSIIARDITEQRVLTDRLSYLASHDGLTELPNRTTFQSELDAHLREVEQAGGQATVLFMDIDHFKYINDRLGHKTGDEVLRAVGQTLKSKVRRKDVVGRIGGDEFAILLRDADQRTARTIASRVLSGIRNLKLASGQKGGLTVSIGMATFPEHARTSKDLLVCADLAMYQAKQGGRDRFVAYRLGAEENRVAPYFPREEDIRTALENDRYLLYCQPIIDMRSGDKRFEVLLRMRDRDGSILLPAEFLPIAERFGMMSDIDRWVVKRSIGLLRQYAERGQHISLDVNLSPAALSDRDLQNMLREELSSGTFDPSSLGFEITETAVIADIKQALRFLRAIKRFGCRFALDDFGMGFSSFYYLKHLPIDYVKIDGSFIRGLADSPVDQRLVHAFVDIAHALGKKAVAEAVEDDATYRLLQAYDVDCAQGYYIRTPGLAEAVLDAELAPPRVTLSAV